MYKVLALKQKISHWYLPLRDFSCSSWYFAVHYVITTVAHSYILILFIFVCKQLLFKEVLEIKYYHFGQTLCS